MFLLLPTPGEAKRLGRQMKMRPDWDEIKFNVMREVVMAKFTQNPDLYQRLLATGNATLFSD